MPIAAPHPNADTKPDRKIERLLAAIGMFLLLGLILAGLVGVKLWWTPALGREPWLLTVVWVLLIAVLLLPIILYLLRGWTHRKDDILSCVSPSAQALYLRNFQATTRQSRAYYDRILASQAGWEEHRDHVENIRRWEEAWKQLAKLRKRRRQTPEQKAAVDLLADEVERLQGLLPKPAWTFVSTLGPAAEADAEREFEKFYTSRFGRWRYFWPTMLLAALAAVLLTFPLAEGEGGWPSLVSLGPGHADRSVRAVPVVGTAVAAAAAAPGPVVAAVPRPIAGDWGWVIAFAILGGYTRVVYELVLRYYQDNIRPADLFWWCYRLLISVPLGYAVAAFLGGGTDSRVAFAVAFLLGLFPTSTVTNLGRHLFAVATKTPESDADALAQLKEVPSLDQTVILLLTEEGITTYTELAYVDPIRLSIRTGKDFSTVVTWVSESLLLGYLTTRDRMEIARRFGIAGAYEAAGLWEDASARPGAPERVAADRLIADLAVKLQPEFTEGGLRSILDQVANDPYVGFVLECWASNFTRTTGPAAGKVSGTMTASSPRLGRFSVGVGDRFAREAKAQLRACLRAAGFGADVVPVWNKSDREHKIIGSGPIATRAAADAAVRDLGWGRAYFVDADHVRLDTVDRFVDPCDFFTIDVADAIGQPADGAAVEAFLARHADLVPAVSVPGLAPLAISRDEMRRVANKFLKAVQQAGAIYRRIAAVKGAGTFITEVSMDETDTPQTPTELLLILAGLADEKVPVRTIAPKFTGAFHKGVDYVGDVAAFDQEFRADLAVLAFAVERFGLPDDLKLSLHSGSDKFTIYGPIAAALRDTKAGLHLKTAGTTWLEEVIGLAEADGPGLALAKEIVTSALGRVAELSAPYASVISIAVNQLPTSSTVTGWTSAEFVAALRHDAANAAYQPHLRQLVHIAFKVAAEMGDRYLNALEQHRSSIEKNVTDNLYERHLKPLFVG